MKRTTLKALFAAAAFPLLVTACGNGSSGSEASGQIDYWLWDANQLPAYQACADAFEKKNPELTVKITQLGWDDYWNRITTGLVSGTAPDVFTNHLSMYPDFAAKNQILAIDEYVERDNVDVGAYANGLADLWVSQEGERYGLPKDWDTIAVFYNKQMLEDAGVKEEQLSNLTWNPQDGGSYEDLIAHLTVDKNGVRGDEPGFDKDNVAVYGLGLEDSGGGMGQTQWSMYTGTTGWTSTNKPTWGTEYNYDDPRFQETIAWWESLIDKGYMPSFEAATAGVSVNDQFGAGKVAMSTNGSWMIGSYFGYKGIETGVAPTPVGPDGERSSMFNGLADAIYAGTDNEEGAWKWVKFLGSTECQDLVAEEAVVFPALPSSLEIAEKKFQEKGVDTEAFTTHLEQDTTFLYPITENAADVDAIMRPAMDAVMAGKADPSSLTEANEQVNALFQ